MKKAAVFSLMGQTASSATTLAFVLVAGRSQDAAFLGKITIGLTVAFALLGLQRAALVEPFIVFRVTNVADAGAAAATWSTTFSLATGGILLLGAALPSGASIALLTAGLGAFSIVPFDAVKSRLYQTNKPKRASMADLVALGSTVGFLLSAWAIHVACLLPVAWSLGTAVGLLAAFRWVDLRPQMRLSWAFSWWRTTLLPFSRWLVLDSVLLNVGAILFVLIVSTSLSSAAVGGLRAVQTLFAPLTLIAPALVQVALPAASAVAVSAGRYATKIALYAALAGVAMTGIYLLLISLVPSLLINLFGASYGSYETVIVPIALGQLVAAVGLAPYLLLRVARAGESIAVCRIGGTAVTLALAAILTNRYDVDGAAWALFMGSIVVLALSGIAAGRHSVRGSGAPVSLRKPVAIVSDSHGDAT